MSDPINRLQLVFERFPGIGPRQAGRFVQFLLRSSPSLRRELAAAIEDLGGSVRQCPKCKRFYAGTDKLCSICENILRDPSLLAVVAHDTDLAAMERSGAFRGLYYVLGGTVSLATDKHEHLCIGDLAASIADRAREGLHEIILALPANTEGDSTAVRVRDKLEPACAEHDITITTLGRGLSTGSELEYADPDTIQNALRGRK
jgi:recombination protein RecR